jgi:superoxide dismutase, Cu-Zn family
MRRRTRITSALCGLFCAVAVLAAPLIAWAQAPTTASARLVDRNGRTLATADLREQPDQVLIALSFASPSALTGDHAIHIHERGQCTAPDFADAGAIFNPQGKEHGLLNPAGPMVGDLPDLVLGADGVAHYNLAAPLATLRPGPNSLLGPGGTSLVITEAADDNQSQPSGNSGARIACGVITAAGQAPADSSVRAGTSSSDLSGSIAIGALGVLLIAGGVLLRISRNR